MARTEILFAAGMLLTLLAAAAGQGTVQSHPGFWTGAFIAVACSDGQCGS